MGVDRLAVTNPLDNKAETVLPGAAGRRSLWQRIATDLACMIRFYSRLPVPKLPFEADAHAQPDFTSASRMVPVAGWIIGFLPALVLAAGLVLKLPVVGACLMSVATALIITGAFHEDGLADTFDGLPGGTTPERRLDIMKDSRIGTFGAAALMLALMLRVAMLHALTTELAVHAALIIVASSGLSRCFGLLPLSFLPPARPSGFSAAAGVPSGTSLALAFGLGLSAWMAVGIWADLALWPLGLAPLMATALVLVLMRWSRSAIGGQTGDIAGAAQQGAEIALLTTLAAGLAHG
jgi:adenosylcobinamide-GDP ribazoletransferase